MCYYPNLSNELILRLFVSEEVVSAVTLARPANILLLAPYFYTIDFGSLVLDQLVPTAPNINKTMEVR